MYTQAKEIFAEVGIDTDAAIFALDDIPISLQCWQGDDFRGFEGVSSPVAGGINVAKSHPGRAKNAEELRTMLDDALKLIPGASKLNLHAMYGDVAGVNRDLIEPRDFNSWVDWAKERKLGLDLNPTMFAHKNASDGLTLSHPDKGIRDFWIEHARRCRKIAAYFGLSLGKLSVMNLWVPDGYKDIPADRLSPRRRLEDSLDEIFRDHYDPLCLLDAVESRPYSIGFEGFTTGSCEFYFGYAVKNGLSLSLGNFHTTESFADKISAAALYVPRIRLHISRPVHRDSEHISLLGDELISVAREIIRHGLLERVYIALDYADNTIDRATAWVIGARAMRKALLIALLEPYRALQRAEESFDFTKRLVIMEEAKTLPWQAVWNEYCERKNMPTRLEF